MGCFKVMEGGGIQNDAQRREGCGIFLTHLLWRGFPKISCPHRLQHPNGAAQPAPNRPWCGLWGLRVCGAPSPRGQPTAGDGGEGFFLTCLGLCCWGLPGSSLGLWGTESKSVRAFSPPQTLGGTRLPRFLVKGERSVFHLAPEAFPPVSTGSSLSDIILPNREHRAGSALAEGDSKELNLGIPPLTNTFPLCSSMSIIPPTPKAKTL